MLTVHIRINDSISLKPTPVRLRISTEEGHFFAPFGLPHTFPVGINEAVGGQVRIDKENWYYINGACEIILPTRVPLKIQATKGPEFTPIDETITLNEGQMAIRLTINRWTKSSHWISVDSRCHFIPPHAALLEAAGEGLQFVNLLAKNHHTFSHDGNQYPLAEYLSAFSGQVPAVERDGCAVVVNTLNTHPTLGRVGLLNCHRTVFPLTYGGEETDDWSVCDWCDQCHRKNGLAIWTDSFQPTSGLLGGEALVAAILGKIDAIEIDSKLRSQPFLPWYYRLLNIGLKLPIVGGSAKDSNGVPLGAMRTYTIAEEPNYQNWVEGVKRGRTYVTNGPILTFTANDSVPGERISTTNPVAVKATAESIQSFDRLELISNGNVISNSSSIQRDGRYFAELSLPIEVSESSWIAVRAMGSTSNPAFAHTSQIYLNVPDKPYSGRSLQLPLLKQSVEETIRWIEEMGQYREPKKKAHILDLCAQALRRLS